MEKSNEYLWNIQKAFSEKYWLELEDDDYFSVYSDIDDDTFYWNEYNLESYTNWNVIYTWKDGKIFYYNEEFIKVLRDTAEKKWESDLVKYLDVEINYYGAESEFEFDPDEFYKEMWVNFDNIEFEDLTEKEKQELVKNFATWVNGIVGKAKEINNKYEGELKNLVKNIRNDKFGLNEKYNKTKDYIAVSSEFLDEYGSIVSKIIELSLAGEDEDNAEESLRLAMSMISLTLNIKTETDAYNQFHEEWAKNTIDLLWWELVY